MTAEHPRRFGQVKVTGKLLDTLFTDVMLSDIHVLEMLEYDRVKDTWTFLCSGPDFLDVIEGCVALYTDADDLRKNREWREAHDDS